MRFYENKCKRNTLQTLYFLAFLFLLGSFYEWVQYRVWVLNREVEKSASRFLFIPPCYSLVG